MDRGSQRLGSRLAELDKSPETSRLLDGPPFGTEFDDGYRADPGDARSSRRPQADGSRPRQGTPWAVIVAIGLVPVMAVGAFFALRGPTNGVTALAGATAPVAPAAPAPAQNSGDLKLVWKGQSLKVGGTAPAAAATANSAAAPATAVANPAAAPSIATAAANPAAAPVATSPAPAAPSEPAVQGVTDTQVTFGMAAPFSGAARDLGRQMKVGVDAAFGELDAAGGIAGRSLKLVTADDGYEPARTAGAMATLNDADKVFAYLGNVGTPTGVVALPYALQRKELFFAPFTGSALFRRDPPDRYVFDYRASYGQETAATVDYLVKVRHLLPKQIAVFAQDDAYGDAGFGGVARAIRDLGQTTTDPLRFSYKRNTIDVADAVSKLQAQRGAVKAVVMVATYRAAAKFIEKTRDQYPALIYTNLSFVGSTQLSYELKLLGPKYSDGVIVTQVVPDVNGYSSLALNYRAALKKYAAGESPDYVSFEGYVDARLLAEGMRRAGRNLTTETLVGALEGLKNLDLGVGEMIGFGPDAHQASNKVWGTVLDKNARFQPLSLN